jgi:hypothetical protein
MARSTVLSVTCACHSDNLPSQTQAYLSSALLPMTYGLEGYVPSLMWKALAWLISFAPGFLLRRLFPPAKCQEQIEITADGVGPHVYVNPERSAAVVNLQLWCYNGLPFDVWLEDIELELRLGDQALTRGVHKIRLAISKRQRQALRLPEFSLTDSQANLARRYPADSEILKITGRTWIKTRAGDFYKQLGQIETRAVIYRGVLPKTK